MQTAPTTSPKTADGNDKHKIVVEVGYEETLPDGRKVFVGQTEGGNDFLLHFTNGQKVTALILSPEALAATVRVYHKLIAPSAIQVEAGELIRLVWQFALPDDKDPPARAQEA